MISYLTSLDPLALWGAILSSALAAIKVYEFWVNRNRFELDYFIRPEESGGNTILIRNLFSKKQTITYWVLQRRKRKFWVFWSSHNLDGPDDDDLCNIEIDAFSSYKLNFEDCSYFPAGKRELGKDKLMLQLRIAGKKYPVTLEIIGYS